VGDSLQLEVWAFENQLGELSVVDFNAELARRKFRLGRVLSKQSSPYNGSDGPAMPNLNLRVPDHRRGGEEPILTLAVLT
jgi:hypothetical protein